MLFSFPLSNSFTEPLRNRGLPFNSCSSPSPTNYQTSCHPIVRWYVPFSSLLFAGGSVIVERIFLQSFTFFEESISPSLLQRHQRRPETTINRLNLGLSLPFNILRPANKNLNNNDTATLDADT